MDHQMKRLTLILVLSLFCLVSGCSQDSGIFSLFGRSDSSAPDNQITIKWPNGDEEKVDKPYFDEYSKNKFSEKCGPYYITSLDDDGLIAIKCPQISEGIKNILDPDHYKNDVRDEALQEAYKKMIEMMNEQIDGIDIPPEGIIVPPPQLPGQGPKFPGQDPSMNSDSKPKLKLRIPEVEGAIDKRIIQKIIRAHIPELTACFEAELAKKKGLSGQVEIVWIISPKGEVTKALVKETTVKNKKVENCMVDSIEKLKFPIPKDGGMAKVVYPFVFE